MKVGVIIPHSEATAGGAFSYANKLIRSIDDFEFDSSLEICFIVKDSLPIFSLKKKVITIPFTSIGRSRWSILNRIRRKLFVLMGIKFLLKEYESKINLLINNDVETYLKSQKVALLYYLEPTLITLDYPYIITHWDLGHKTTYAFPEVSMNGIYKHREEYNKLSLGKAFAIFAESEQSKKELINYEKINSKRIFVVPLFAGPVIDLSVSSETQNDILNKWGIRSKSYFFYPAQFWSHKNHFGLITAFKKVLITYPKTKLVLSGSDKGNLIYIKNLIHTFNISDSVIITGFVKDEEVFTFYKNAISLVMPTFLGPTNMPLLEAYYLGCKVLCSNLEGHKEQMATNAVYFDPADFDEIADKMLQEIRSLKKINTYSPIPLPNPVAVINEHLMIIVPIRSAFGFDYNQL